MSVIIRFRALAQAGRKTTFWGRWPPRGGTRKGPGQSARKGAASREGIKPELYILCKMIPALPPDLPRQGDLNLGYYSPPAPREAPPTTCAKRCPGCVADPQGSRCLPAPSLVQFLGERKAR
jgi:hypothetical protein